MGICDDGRRPVGQDGFDKFCRGNHAALQVDMGIQKPGADDLTSEVQLLLPGIVADADDQPIGAGDICRA